MKIKLNYFVPTATHPNLEEVCVTNLAMFEPTPTTVYEWAHTVLDGRRFEYPLDITIRVDGQRWFVPLWLMKYQHEWVSDPFADDGDGLGIGCDTFYVLKPFLPFTPADHALIEDDWTDSKGEHSIRTDYSMDNAGVLYTGKYPTRYSFTLIHKEIKGTLFRR
jgi:hypothetical protein